MTIRTRWSQTFDGESSQSLCGKRERPLFIYTIWASWLLTCFSKLTNPRAKQEKRCLAQNIDQKDFLFLLREDRGWAAVRGAIRLSYVGKIDFSL
ncbi:hypothetical protein CEXT_457651 [Caerostris extrusa]|uniref:Uncharacterized protein n=1 Tax=Caerostris extrusa TaxID=172846 RepID=A0AAV4N376_CAEEX|nr:hypothetical protein CEXT_457651 [Caerostris extrusa]